MLTSFFHVKEYQSKMQNTFCFVWSQDLMYALPLFCLLSPKCVSSQISLKGLHLQENHFSNPPGMWLREYNFFTYKVHPNNKHQELEINMGRTETRDPPCYLEELFASDYSFTVGAVVFSFWLCDSVMKHEPWVSSYSVNIQMTNVGKIWKW